MISKIIHHSAPKSKNSWHPVWKICLSTWYKNFSQQEYQHIMWDDSMIDDFIEDKFFKYYHTYTSFPFHIMQLDFSRICFMYEFGGIYADMDYYCFENFYNDLNGTSFIVESPAQNEIFQNSLLISEPKQKIWLDLLEEILDKYFYYDILYDYRSVYFNSYVKTISGPNSIDRLYENDPKKFEGVSRLESEKYNPIISDFNKKEKLKNAKAFHFLSGLWGREKKKHISQDMLKINLKSDDYDYEQLLKKEYFKMRNIDIDEIK
jgi:inositol phosphorylceramide mannosyltransferase catalytic subunit